MEILPMAQPTKRVEPTGGVTRPIPRFSMRIIPKWTGSTPMAVTTGKRIGVGNQNQGSHVHDHPQHQEHYVHQN